MPLGAEKVYEVLRKSLQILRYGPREQALLLVAGGLFVGARAFKIPERTSESLQPFLETVPLVLYVIGGALVLIAGLRIQRKVVAPPPPTKPKPAAIKGPAPFGPQDAELFARLGRSDDLDLLRSWVLDDQKPLVALMGESGVGKTSLLRAGLERHLREDEISVTYWEALPTDPEAGLLHAVRSCWKDERKAPKTFDELAAAVESGRQVVVIDQAEQLSPDRHPRIFELLRQVVAARPPYRATWVVAFRREYSWVWRQFELSLPKPVQGRLETLPLEKLSPATAKKVIAVLATEAELPVEQKVVEALVESLTVNGGISPTDIGISLLMLSELAGDPAASAFSLEDFRESGGQAGLLTRYLEKRLEQFPEAERREVLQALLSLVDREKNQRVAEGCTLEELKHSSQSPIPVRFEANLAYLARSRVLEEWTDREGVLRYRLVHERLIPAIQRLTGVLLAEADKAGLLLDRMYRVWAADRRNRYLLSGKDLGQVLRFRNQLPWGADIAEKREYVRLSRRVRNQRWGQVAGLALVLCMTIYQYGEAQSRDQTHRSLLQSWRFPEDLYDRLGQFEELTLPGTVTRVDWLSKARRLKILTIEDGALESLEGLPPGLQTLRIGRSRLKDLAHIPSSLVALELGRSEIESLAGLPEKLRALEIEGDLQLDVSVLPASLESLTLSLDEWRKLPNLTALRSLQYLRLTKSSNSDKEDHEISSHLKGLLPPGIRSLFIRIPGFVLTSPEDLPDDLRSLDCPQSKTLEGLPNGLLDLSIRQSVPDLTPFPKSLQRLTLSTDIREYQRLDFRHLTKLRALRLELSNLYYQPVGVDLDLRNTPPSLRSLTLRLIEEPPNRSMLRSGGLRLPDQITFLNFYRERTLISEDVFPIEPPRDLRWLRIGYGLQVSKLPPRLVHLSIGEASPKLELPASLIHLSGDVANVSLPKGLRSLSLYRADNLPKISSLAYLNSLKLPDSDKITKLPSSIPSLMDLDISSTSIQSLEDLPPNLLSLKLSPGQVDTLKGLPESVTAIHFSGRF